jgi:hypothetical protein
MKWSRWFGVVCTCILLSGIVQPAGAFIDPGLAFSIAFFSGKPGYQKTAQDYVHDGDFWKDKCVSMTDLYNERLRSYVQDAADKTNTPVDMSQLEKPSPGQRHYLMSTGFHARDPTAAGYYENMMLACDNAQRSYSKAFQLTRDDDYLTKAEILEAGVDIYYTLGMPEQAREVEKAAETARHRDTASGLFSALLPLPGWVAIIGVIGGLVMLNRKKKEV